MKVYIVTHNNGTEYYPTRKEAEDRLISIHHTIPGWAGLSAGSVNVDAETLLKALNHEGVVTDEQELPYPNSVGEKGK